MKHGHDLRHYPFLALEQEALLPPVDQKRCIFFWDMLCSTRLSGYAFFFSVSFFLQSYSLYSYRKVRGCMGMCRSLLIRDFHLKVFGVNFFSLSLSLEEVIKATCCTRRIFVGAMNKKM